MMQEFLISAKPDLQAARADWLKSLARRAAAVAADRRCL
jgi:hypothetical protein